MTGKELLKLREKYRITQQEVADELGYTPQNVCYWEVNDVKLRKASIDGITRLCDRKVSNKIDRHD